MTTAPTSSPSRSLTLRQAPAANAQPTLAEVQEFPSGRTTWLGSPVTAFDCRRPLAMILAVASPWLLALLVGCGGQPEEGSSGEAAGATEATVVAEAVGEPPVYELDPVRLAAATLPPEQLAEGWVRLFDEQSLAGWFVVGNADWQVVDGTLQVTQGERSYLCTSFMLADYELKVDFRCDPETNSGIFLRTTPEPQSVEFDCLELNIAPPENLYPTGSFVQRQQLPPEKLPGFDPTDWHTYHIRVAGEQVQVSLDGEPIIELSDTTSSRRGHISLQHNQGRIAFRNILLRPVDARELSVGSDWQTDWTKSEKTENAFTVEPIDEGLHLVGGLGQLQSQRDFGDFLLQAEYTLAQPEVNSGIFFRCIRDAMLDGYECQVNHAMLDGDPLQPADAGAGAIFRRQSARMVIGEGTSRTFLTLLASGPQMVSWVNGIQVVDFTDTRPADENPRKGTRTDPGPISLQGHDPTTDVIFHRLRVSQLR